jgi:hypothetical protein
MTRQLQLIRLATKWELHMKGINQVGFALVLGLPFLSGCGQDAPTTPVQAAGSAANQVASKTTGDSAAIARAATDFMHAVIKGDIQSASALLTPQAIERIIATKTPFNPSGLQTATFQLGEIRTPAQDQAIVQFLLSDSSAAEPEEGCCLLKRVANEWRVSGIAYGIGPNQPWTLSDFETGQSTAIPRQSTRGRPVQQASATTVSGRPSPPRTAEEAVPATLR